MMADPKQTAQQAGRKAQRSTTMRVMARAGLATSGLMHLILGFIVIRMGIPGEDEGEEASQSGALAQVAEQPGGEVVLGIAAVGLLSLSLWQVLTAIFGQDAAERVKGAGKAVVYGVLGVLAGRYALGMGGGGTDEEGLTARVMGEPWGPYAVGAMGLGIAIAGIVHIVIGVRAGFEKTIRTSSKPAVAHTVRTLGRVGYIAKGVALGVLGGLFITAALTADPEEAGGLDEAFATIGSQPFGSVLLIVTGAGIACFGLFSLARSRYEKL